MCNKKLISLLLSLIMLLSMAIPCAIAEEESSFTFISTEPVTLNMMESDSNLDTYVFYLTSAMLYRSIDGVITPELCDTMTVSEDGCTYTYTIKDAVYSDGTAITADDFAYGMIKAYLTSENCIYFVGGEDAYNNSLDTCEGIYAVDDKTFVVQLIDPIVTFDGELEIYPINQAFAEEKGAAYGGTADDLQYSGPYILNEWVVGSELTFTKNDSYIYADELFPIQNLTLVNSVNASTSYSMYLSGDVDAILSIGTELSEMFGTDQLNWCSAGSLYGIEFNTTGYTYTEGDGFSSRGEDVTALMQNMNFRKALVYALDREALAAACDPSGRATDRYISSYAEGTTEGSTFVEEFPLTESVPMNGDLDLAKEYLDAALSELGYSDVSELPELTFMGFEVGVQKVFIETIVALWSTNLGLTNIQIDIQPIQSAIMSMVYMDYDFYFQSLTLDPDDILSLLAYWETTGSVSDVAGFQQSGAPASMVSMHANEEYDALVESCYTNFDTESRLADVATAEQMLYNDLVFFPLSEGGVYYIAQDYVEGLVDTSVDEGYSFANLVVNK